MISNSPSSSETSEQVVSSQLGRKWLVASDDAMPISELCSESTPGVSAGENSDPGTVFVKIPDVGTSIGDAFSTLEYSLMSNPDELAAALSDASNDRLQQATGAQELESAATGATLALALAQAAEPEGSIATQLPSPQNDLSEPPAEWTDKPATKDTSRTEKEKPPKQSTQNLAIEKLANAIVDRFPLGDPTVLLFVGTEPNRHIDETCARVSSALAERKIGRILLLDSDTASHSLSNASGVSGQPGVTDVVNGGIDWEATVYGRSATGLDFMAAGTGVFHHPESRERLRNAVAQMKREYQFICISAGDAHSDSARLWNDICDGSYLLVSMKNSNQTIAKSAVAEMQSSGARLLGCVVTDVD